MTQEPGAYTSLVETLHSLQIHHRCLTRPEIWEPREHRARASVVGHTVGTCRNRVTPARAVPASVEHCHKDNYSNTNREVRNVKDTKAVYKELPSLPKNVINYFLM